VFIKTQMEDDPTLAAMFTSIERCKNTIESEAPRIPKREIRAIIYDDLEPALGTILSFRDAAQKGHKTLFMLEPGNPNGPYEEIDAQKIIAQHAFRKLVIQTGSVYVLSGRTNLLRPRYWCESAMTSTPSVGELIPTKASLNESAAYDPCKLVQ